MPRWGRWIGRAVVMGSLVLAVGCSPLVRQRTLPPSIRSVYVPIAINRTAEVGIDEQLTTFVQEELLADGRLDLANRGRANALVEVTIRRFRRTSFGFDSLRFATSQRIEMEAEVVILENIPGRPRIGGSRRVTTVAIPTSDPRTTTYEPEPRRMESFLRTAAREIVREVLTGEYREEESVPDAAEAPAAAAGS